MENCIFCKILNGEIPSMKWYEDDMVMAFLDIEPESNGHTLLIPKKHIKDIYEMDDETLSHLMITARKLASVLEEKLQVKGIKFVQNNGCFQDVKHYHLHIIPSKDSKMIDIKEVFEKLKD